MSHYQQLAAQFGKVRRSWKRAAALSGLAVVVTESMGILALLLFLDWLYRPLPEVRLGMWALALAAILYFAARHVAAPLLRKISDRQIALYIEEHRRELDGILITAAEYGPRRDGITGDQAELVDTVLAEAAARARVSARQVVDLARLKKYGLGAVAGLFVFGVSAILFPRAVGHHIARVAQPWNVTAEDQRKRLANQPPGPMVFTFSKGDASLARGASFDFEVELSRASSQPVELNFRPRTSGAQWQTLPMKPIDKLNGFQGALADVSEDLEFQVVTGGDKSATHQLKVFDPLVIQSLDVTTHYPAYAKLPDRVETRSKGDIAALEGSTVTVRLVASNPVKEGQLQWTNGRTQAMAVDPNAPNVATVSFEVKEETGCQYSIADVNGQKTAGDAVLAIHVLPDNPPTLKVKAPQAMVMTNPVGEIVFDAEADDDFGLDGVDLLYTRVKPNGETQETRVPLVLEAATAKDAPNGSRGGYRLMLEDFNPACAPEEAIAYHLEARDSKGQKAVSDIGLITVGYFETWTTWSVESQTPVAGAVDDGPDLLAMLKAVWQLNTQKANLPEADFQKQSKELAALMCDKKTGALRNFVDIKKYPQLAKVAAQITLHAKNALEALNAADTVKASVELSAAAAIASGGKLLEADQVAQAQKTTPPPAAGSLTSEMPQLTPLEKQRIDAIREAAGDSAKVEKAQDAAAAAADTAKALGALIKQQDEIIGRANNPAKPAGAALLAEQEKALAAKAKQTAATVAKAASTSANAGVQQSSGKLMAAVKSMDDAAGNFAANKSAEGQAGAAVARKQLQEALDAVNNDSREKLEEAIVEAERRATELLEKQQALSKTTEPLSKELNGNAKADQRQTRDLQDLAGQQAKAQGEAEALNELIGRLNEWAPKVGKPEVVRSLGDAMRTIKRGQPEKKMANAVVDLNSANPTSALQEQGKASDALEKICESLRNSDDALADTRSARLKSAASKVAKLKAELAKLDAPQAGQTAGPAPQAGQQPGLAPQAGQKPGPAPQAGQQPGPAPQAGQKPGPAPQAGQQPGPAPQAGQKSGPAPQAGQQPGPAPQAGQKPGPAPKPANAPGLAHSISSIVTTLDDRGIVPQELIEKLKKLSENKEELEQSLVADPKFVKDVQGVITDINSKLEKEVESMNSASRLFSFQRQECPPSYRQFVNKYFEALSESGRTPVKP